MEPQREEAGQLPGHDLPGKVEEHGLVRHGQIRDHIDSSRLLDHKEAVRFARRCADRHGLAKTKLPKADSVLYPKLCGTCGMRSVVFGTRSRTLDNWAETSEPMPKSKQEVKEI